MNIPISQILHTSTHQIGLRTYKGSATAELEIIDGVGRLMLIQLPRSDVVHLVKILTHFLRKT